MLELLPARSVLGSTGDEEELLDPIQKYTGGFQSIRIDSRRNRLKKEFERVKALGVMAGQWHFNTELFCGNYSKWKFWFLGPIDSPFENGLYFGEVHFPVKYPFEAPKISISTGITHPYVNKDGFVLFNLVLGYKWTAATTFSHFIIAFEKVLRDPFGKRIEDELNQGHNAGFRLMSAIVEAFVEPQYKQMSMYYQFRWSSTFREMMYKYMPKCSRFLNQREKWYKKAHKLNKEVAKPLYKL